MNKSCDIIIPVWNQLSFTRDCVDSISANTGLSDYGLIIIDNASDDPTRAYLDELKRSGKGRVTVVRNQENNGFIKAANQGLRLSSRPYACILNNDTLVFKDWLKIMIGIAEAHKEIGIVNPSSNNLGQRTMPQEPLETYAERLAKEHDSYVELGAAIGFCMLIKREVIEKVGMFDEIYGMGNFEDTDFSRKATQHGYRVVRACGAYVYHRENSSFKNMESFDYDFKRNKEIYEFRWGKPRRIAYIFDSYDNNMLMRLNMESLKLARSGNWVWYFSRTPVNKPAHSNIISVEIPDKNFYITTAFKILKKKKKFDDIFVTEDRFGKALERLSFIHKAKIKYY